MQHQTLRALALTSFAAVALAGCESDKTGSCPTMTALVAASEQSVFVPKATPDPSNLLYKVEIISVKGDCDVDKKALNADVKLEVHFRATRAPSGTSAEYRAPYFVAVTEGTDRVLAKKNFTVPFAFAPGQSTADFSDSIASTEVQSKGEKRTYDYQVLVGLQLTKEQLDYNRSQGH
ncbi:MAG: hypothetical protein ABSD74_16880 [Rhizomicrobium sp.]|jgi:hypothetical protein